MDHPTITNPKDPGQLKRQMVVLFDRVSHKFNKMWIEGNSILSELETTSNRNGVDLARMAYIDKIPIGFSCRAMGKVRPSSMGKGIVEVIEPTHFVTYDSVTDPSHKTAQLTDITNAVSAMNNINKICTTNISEASNIALDESVSFMEFSDLFEMKNPMDGILKRFLGETYYNETFSEKQKVECGKTVMDNILKRFMSTSCKKSGISTVKDLNESNVHDLMTDYAYTHKTEYDTSEKIRKKILKYLYL